MRNKQKKPTGQFLNYYFSKTFNYDCIKSHNIIKETQKHNSIPFCQINLPFFVILKDLDIAIHQKMGHLGAILSNDLNQILINLKIKTLF